MAAAVLTLMEPLLLVLPAATSLAVIVQAVLRVAVASVTKKVPLPLVKVALLTGTGANGSLLLNCTVPV